MEPRWEYRIWTKNNAFPALAQIRALGREDTDESRTDTYLLPDATDLSPKLRGRERFEVKRLLDVRDGLEEWRLSESAEFPLNPEVVERYLAHIDGAACMSPDDLIYRAALEGLLVIPVQKHRKLFEMDNVRAEITEVTGAGLAPLTIGLEGGSFEATRDTARDLGLMSLPNTDYGTALRATH